MFGGVMDGHLGWGILEEGWRKGPWTAEEDKLLIDYVSLHGEGRWNYVARFAGLKRNGKSCRLRWVNYLRPDLKRGRITPHEEKLIIELHARWGNRWSTIARSLPGRTDNEIKNYWRTHFKKKEKISSEHPNKSKTRLLRQKQFQQQQQQNQFDMKKIVPQLDENDNRVSSSTQGKQEIAFMYHDSLPEEQCILSFMFDGDTYSMEASSSEDILWSGLWNLNENQVTPFC